MQISSREGTLAKTMEKNDKMAWVTEYPLKDKDNLLSDHLEYMGDDFDDDTARMAADPETGRW